MNKGIQTYVELTLALLTLVLPSGQNDPKATQVLKE